MDSNFRIIIFLNKFYDDHRKKVFVLVDKSWTRIEELQKHIETLFKFDKIYLTTEDCIYLPPNECISVVNCTDNIIAHPVNKIKKFLQISNDVPNLNSNNIQQDNTENDPNPESLDNIEVKKRRIRKRKKKLESNNSLLQNNLSSTESTLPLIKSPESASTASPLNKKCSKWIKDVIQLDQNGGNNNINTKQNKNHSLEGENTADVALKPNTHIKFNDEASSSEEEQLNVPPLAARVIKASYIETTIQNECKKQNQTNEETQNVSLSTSSETALETIRNNIDKMAFETVKGMPVVSDIIAFKVAIKCDIDIIISDYIVGMVQMVLNNELTLYIMAGKNELKEKDVIDCEENVIKLHRSELLKLKLVKL